VSFSLEQFLQLGVAKSHFTCLSLQVEHPVKAWVLGRGSGIEAGEVQTRRRFDLEDGGIDTMLCNQNLG
jgi:hypothetical protein